MTNLVSYKDPILKQKMELFDFNNPPVDPFELTKTLTKVMDDNNGLGLSACQIGLPYNVFVMNTDPLIACFNPKIVDQSEEIISLEEGCLSFPNVSIKVKRPRRIKVRFTKPNGETVTETFYDMTARVFLHEYDHCQGLVMFDRANKYHVEQAKKKMKKNKL